MATTNDEAVIDVNARVQAAIDGMARFAKGVTAAWAAVKTLQGALNFSVETSKMAADLQRQELAFRTTTQRFGLYGKQLMADLTAVTRGTVSEFQLMQRVSQAALLNLPIDKLPELFEVARVAAVATGQSMDDLTNRIVTGIGKKSVEMLDELGIRATGAFSAYAQSIGKTTQELTANEQQEALMVRVLEEKKRIMESLGPLLDEVTETDRWAHLTKSIDEAKRATGEWLASFVGPGRDLLDALLGKVTTFFNSLNKTSYSDDEISEAIAAGQAQIASLGRTPVFSSTRVYSEQDIHDIARIKRDMASLQAILDARKANRNRYNAAPPSPPNPGIGPGVSRLPPPPAPPPAMVPTPPTPPGAPGGLVEIPPRGPRQDQQDQPGSLMRPGSLQTPDQAAAEMQMLSQHMATFQTQVQALATSGAVDSLFLIAQALGQAGQGAGSLAENLAAVGAALTKDISKLAFRAALTVLSDFPLTPAKWATAAGLAAIGGLSGIVSGALAGRSGSDTSSLGSGRANSPAGYDRGGPAVIVYSPTIIRGTQIDARRGVASLSRGARFER